MDRRTFFGALAALPMAATAEQKPRVLGYDFSDGRFVYSNGQRIGWTTPLDGLEYDGKFVTRLVEYASGLPLFQHKREDFFWNV